MKGSIDIEISEFLKIKISGEYFNFKDLNIFVYFLFCNKSVIRIQIYKNLNELPIVMDNLNNSNVINE